MNTNMPAKFLDRWPNDIVVIWCFAARYAALKYPDPLTTEAIKKAAARHWDFFLEEAMLHMLAIDQRIVAMMLTSIEDGQKPHYPAPRPVPIPTRIYFSTLMTSAQGPDGNIKLVADEDDLLFITHPVSKAKNRDKGLQQIYAQIKSGIPYNPAL